MHSLTDVVEQVSPVSRCIMVIHWGILDIISETSFLLGPVHRGVAIRAHIMPPCDALLLQTRFLGLAGGSSVGETTRAVMRRLMSTKVAQQTNWLGKGKKTAFSKLKLREIVSGLLSV